MDSRSFENIIEGLSNNQDTNQLLEALKLIYKLLNNICMNPQEQKYRNINSENKTLKAKVFNINQIVDLLQATGFSLDLVSNQYSCPDANVHQIFSNIGTIQNHIKLLEAKQLSPEDYQKELLLQQERKAQQAKLQKENQERERLKNLMQHDLQEQKYKEVKDSVNQGPKQFGASTKTCKDMGIGEKKGGG